MMTPIDERQPLLLPVVGIIREDADGDDLNATTGNITKRPEETTETRRLKARVNPRTRLKKSS